MKSLQEHISESLHTGPMHIRDIISVLVNDYNLRFFNAKEYPEIARFLPYSGIKDLDLDKTIKDIRCGIGISSSEDGKSFGMGINYISTVKPEFGGETVRRKSKDWIDMDKDQLSNLVICMRNILRFVDDKVEKEYTKHPNGKDLENEIRTLVSRLKPRSFSSRGVEVGVFNRELTKDDKKSNFSQIIDIVIVPDRPQIRLSIGVDKNNCLRWTEQYSYGDCRKGLETPAFLVTWSKVESIISRVLSSY